jgi:asparagine synthetase B (glutamine-hydrolysing)
MFAIAVYDRRETGRRGSEFRVSSSELSASGDGGTLFLARDRLGIKPLYYYAQNSEFRVSGFELGVKAEAVHHRDTENSEAAQRRSDLLRSELETRNSKLETGGHFVETGGPFIFASEVRTLLASGVVPKRLSRSALESYLLFGSVSEPMTLVEGILSLPPGHRMTIRMNSSRTAPAAELKPESYWNVAREIGKTRRSTVNGNAKKTDTKAAAAQVRALLEESVRKHLIADVPVGVFLSSGIDSTCLAALASREVSGVHTFTVAFPEKEFSEAALARRTAEK